MPSRSLSASLVVLASLLAFAPVAAQTGRDLLQPEPRAAVEAERLSLVERGDAVRVAALDRGLASVDPAVAGVRQPATEVYQYDDNVFEGFYRLVDNVTNDFLYEMEFAQRFRLPEAGTVEYAVACMARARDDTSADAAFTLSFYSGSGNVPVTLLGAFDVPARLPDAATYLCFEIGGAVTQLELNAGQVWVAVSWTRGTPSTNTKLLAVDEDGSGGRRAFRARDDEDDEWERWQVDTDPGVYGIALAVNHPDPEPEPEPDPDPTPDPTPDPGPEPDPDAGPPTGEGYTDCVPETSPLVFDGYNVRMCYETGGGTVGEAKAGIWASGESGLLWFFNRDNAEVLVKVLNGCHINNHRWVYVAPVTDLAFNLYVVDSQGRTWSHHNRQGDTASTRSDNEAFPCNN
ncbi:MAG: hypothetical protein F4060_09550 [Holophagales bacterium]|nr:hypothetical protein [Holophagales bacterium]MYG32214.1 hypothetical protein [Holophagales bacterium]MYI80177.1 hypothetical protein [Holophagales bacterium]